MERGEVAVIELAIVEEFGEREPEFDRGAFESAALAYIVTHDITDVRLRRDIVEVVVAAGDRAMVKHKINASTD